MSQETLLISIFFLAPGFFAVQVFRFLLVEEELSTFGLTTWSLIYSVLGIAALILLPWTHGTVDYLFDPVALTRSPTRAAIGVLLQLLMSSLIATGLALFIRSALGGRIGGRSFYKRSWDYLWTEHGREPRYILIETEAGLYYGTLCFADSAAAGRDIILSNPAKYDSDAGDFYQNGMKFMLVPGDVIKRVEVSIAEPNAKTDKPLPQKGYLGDGSGRIKERGGDSYD